MKIKFVAVSLGFFFLFVFFASDGLAMSKRPGRHRPDRESRDCIRCHNMDRGRHYGPAHSTHVIGIDYVTLSERDPSLVLAGKLDPRIRLVKGNISCITCHTKYDEESHKISQKERESAKSTRYPMLRVDNSASGLCLKCHLK